MTIAIADQRWIRCLRPNPAARLRLFCLPFAGGGTTPFRSWARALPADVEVCAVCLPGREDRRPEPLVDRLGPLVDALAQAITPWLDRPFVLYGHSMGALLGFELARALRTRGATPARLVVSARGAPDRPLNVPRLCQLPDAEFVTALSARYNGIPRVILDEPELLAMFIPILRADLSLLETYDHAAAEPLACPISVFGGTRDPLIGDADLAGWRAHTTADFRHQLLDGDHFFIQGNQDRFLACLAEELQP